LNEVVDLNKTLEKKKKKKIKKKKKKKKKKKSPPRNFQNGSLVADGAAHAARLCASPFYLSWMARGWI
jgi:hypothetical protein